MPALQSALESCLATWEEVLGCGRGIDLEDDFKPWPPVEVLLGEVGKGAEGRGQQVERDGGGIAAYVCDHWDAKWGPLLDWVEDHGGSIRKGVQTGQKRIGWDGNLS